jgi:hypothetical protein
MADVTKWSENETGCYVDGHRGQYAITHMIDIAHDNGFKLSDLDQYRVNEYNYADSDRADIYETVYELGDKAEQWMNDNLAIEGYSFGWHDGEFYYWSNESWEEM